MKVVDATVVSASIKEIRAIDFLKLISYVYDISTTPEVLEEITRGFDQGTVERAFEHIHVIETRRDEYHSLLEWLEKRYPYLHRGELSTFLLAVLEYRLVGTPCFYVTDDGTMRRKIRKILIEARFIELLGRNPPSIRMTGTVGLIGRLYELGMIGVKDLEEVMRELQTGTFRITSEVLRHLRRMLNEG